MTIGISLIVFQTPLCGAPTGQHGRDSSQPWHSNSSLCSQSSKINLPPQELRRHHGRPIPGSRSADRSSPFCYPKCCFQNFGRLTSLPAAYLLPCGAPQFVMSFPGSLLPIACGCWLHSISITKSTLVNRGHEEPTSWSYVGEWKWEIPSEGKHRLGYPQENIASSVSHT